MSDLITLHESPTAICPTAICPTAICPTAICPAPLGINHISNFCCLKKSEKNGKQLYKHNENYRTIANCMEHPEFRKLFDTHFTDWDSLKTILMFLKLYQKIEKISPIELNGYQKISILDSIINDRQLRHEICKEVSGISDPSCNDKTSCKFLK